MVDFVRALCGPPDGQERRRVESAHLVIGGIDLSADYRYSMTYSCGRFPAHPTADHREQLSAMAVDGVDVDPQSYVRGLELVSRSTVVWPNVYEMLRRGEKRPLHDRDERSPIGEPLLDTLNDVARSVTRTTFPKRQSMTLEQSARPEAIANDQVLKRSYSDERRNVCFPSEYMDYLCFARDRVEQDFKDAWLVEDYVLTFHKLGTWRCYFAGKALVRIIHTKLSGKPGARPIDLSEAVNYNLEAESEPYTAGDLKYVDL